MKDPYAWKPVTEMSSSRPGVYWVRLKRDKRILRAAWIPDSPETGVATWRWLVRAPYTGDYCPFYRLSLFDRVRLITYVDGSFASHDVAGNMTHNRTLLARPGRRGNFIQRLLYVPPEERAQYREING
jgi:hypothetical protein